MSTNPANLQQSKGLSELWRRLRFVFLAIIIYRIGTHIPIPGIDPERLATLFEQNQGTLLDLFNMFSGGALERMSIMALNIMPYITASIIMSLLEGTTPSLKGAPSIITSLSCESDMYQLFLSSQPFLKYSPPKPSLL